MGWSFKRLRRDLLRMFGVDPARVFDAPLGLPWYLNTARKYHRGKSEEFPLRCWDLRPFWSDRKQAAAKLDWHYLHQDLWAARKVFAAGPARHVDVGSRIDGFVTHVLTFMPVTVIDVRPLRREVPGLDFVHSDASDMTGFDDDSLESLSCLHAVEHFGLGRYGDPVDAEAWRRALRAFQRVLAPAGRLYLSVPVGRQRVEFNAHRVFDPRTVIDTLDDLTLLSFAAVDDSGAFVAQATPERLATANYGCGLFEFTKQA